MTKPSIEASAGTGKTTRVVQLLLGQLLATDIEPSRLLALTFTVRAANEMRDRLGAWLTRLVAGERVTELGGGLEQFGDVDAARRRGTGALAELDRLEIGTIHSFAAHLLRQYPLEAGVSPAFEEDEGGAQAALFRERWPRWLEERLAEPAGRAFVERLLARVEPMHLRAFAEALCDEGVPLAPEAYPERAVAWRRRLDAAAAHARDLREAHADEGHVGPRAACAALEFMAELFSAPAATPALRARAGLLQPSRKAVERWGAVEQEAYVDLRALARRVVEVDDALMTELLAWLVPFVHEFRREFTRLGWVSFQGLIERAGRLLREHRDVRDHLKGRFHLIVVDEFQDTDPEQAALLLCLAEREHAFERDWRRVEVAPGKLVIVGDPKQSIYLFRGADLEAYADIAGRLTGGDEANVERLTTNYRARDELIHFVNAVGAEFLRHPPYVPLEPHEGPGGRVEMILFRDLGAGAAREAEAEAIAAWIERGVADGEFRRQGVALLLRALPDARHYTDALRRRGIDFVIEGEKHFYAAQEVVDLVNLLGAIADPTNELAVVGVLRSPLGAVMDRDLVALRDAGGLSPLAAERVPATLPHVRRLYEAMASLNARARRVPVPALVHDVLERFPVLAVARASFRGEQAVANVEKLVQALAAAGGMTLAAALQEYRRRMEEREEEGEAALADEGVDAVRILSIHKAKGLEFPVVVLPDLHRGEGPKDHGPVLRAWLADLTGFRCGRLRSSDRVAAEERWERIGGEESERLLYVALTRAKERLLLTGGDPEGSVLLAMVLQGLAANGLAVGREPLQTLRGDGFEVTVTCPVPTEPAWSAAPPPAPGPEPDYEAERAEWVRREVEARRAAATPPIRRPSLPREPDVERVFRLEREEDEADGLSVGSRCHDVLAAMDLAHPDGHEAAGEVRAILEGFFASAAFAEIRAADEVHRELPFVVELDGEVWSGQIDVLYRLGGRWIVADYKSDREEHPARYRTQARVYTRAVQRLLGLPGPPAFRLLYLRTGRSVPV